MVVDLPEVTEEGKAVTSGRTGEPAMSAFAGEEEVLAVSEVPVSPSAFRVSDNAPFVAEEGSARYCDGRRSDPVDPSAGFEDD